MRKFILLIFALMTLQVVAQVHVNGYYRKDGTYVRSHYRSNPDGNPYNNWSFPGNTNPYTGKVAPGNPSTYLKNYCGTSGNTHNFPNSSVTTYAPPIIPNTSTIGSDLVDNLYAATKYVTANSLNIRSGPSKNYKTIGSLSKLDRVKVLTTNSNGWSKVRFEYFDNGSFEFKSGTGYVYDKYLSVHPFGGQSFSNVATPTSIPALNPYGNRNGRITVWTNLGTDGAIKIYLDGVYVGSLTDYFRSSTPSCGQSGTLIIDRPAGRYKLEGRSENYSWSTMITVEQGRCKRQQLKK